MGTHQGNGALLIGGIVAIGMGVIVIAGIYQLNQPGGSVVPATQSVATTTLNSIFK